MDIGAEIERYASEADKPALVWLFERYHLAEEWRIMAKCTIGRYGVQSYAFHRIWKLRPTGSKLYATRDMIVCDKCHEIASVSPGTWSPGAGVCDKCGNNLCAACVGSFSDDGYCAACAKEGR